MAKKEVINMTESNNAAMGAAYTEWLQGRAETDFVKATKSKPKQDVVEIIRNVAGEIEDINSEAQIEVAQTRYELIPFSAKTHGNAEFYARYIAAFAENLVPESERVSALLVYASNATYKAGKKAALAAGSYIVPELKSAIVNALRMLPAFAEDSAAKTWSRFLAGLKAKNPFALKMLAAQQAILDMADGAESL